MALYDNDLGFISIFEHVLLKSSLSILGGWYVRNEITVESQELEHGITRTLFNSNRFGIPPKPSTLLTYEYIPNNSNP